jgi:NAD(P)H-dependent FMN reductase
VVTRASAHPDFQVELLDLRDWPLPMFAEHMGTIGDVRDPTYSDPVVKRWNAKLKEGDAYLVVTPEYNHSVPGVLKNAVDSVFVSFALRNKPIAAVGYSGGIAAATRAIEHLAHIAIEADMHPLRNSVLIPFVRSAFDAEGAPTNPATEVAMTILLDDLAWWSRALERARAEGELPPTAFRGRESPPAGANKVSR